MYLQFKIEGVTELSRNLLTIDRQLRDWKPQFQESGRYMVRFFSGEVFETRGRSFGEPWKRLSARYAAWKERRYPGRGILERTGKMRKSFEYEAAGEYVRVFNGAPYFKYHQSRLPRTRIPRRVMMKLDEKRKQTIVKIFHEAANRAIKNAFR